MSKDKQPRAIDRLRAPAPAPGTPDHAGRAEPPAPVAPAPPAVPPEFLVRRDRSLRYERGGAVYATDGRVGVLRQVVVDEAAGEVVALVVEIEALGRRVLVAPQLVDKTGGAAVFLQATRQEVADHVLAGPAYDKDRYKRANLKALLRGRDRAGRDPRRAVAEAGKHLVATPAVSLAAGSLPPAPEREDRGVPAGARTSAA